MTPAIGGPGTPTSATQASSFVLYLAVAVTIGAALLLGAAFVTLAWPRLTERVRTRLDPARPSTRGSAVP